MLNNNETALIHAKDFLLAVNNLGLEVTKYERTYLLKIFGTLNGSMFQVDSIQEVLEKLGIREDIPISGKFLDYSKLDNTSIRLMN